MPIVQALDEEHRLVTEQALSERINKQEKGGCLGWIGWVEDLPPWGRGHGKRYGEIAGAPGFVPGGPPRLFTLDLHPQPTDPSCYDIPSFLKSTSLDTLRDMCWSRNLYDAGNKVELLKRLRLFGRFASVLNDPDGTDRAKLVKILQHYTPARVQVRSDQPVEVMIQHVLDKVHHNRYNETADEHAWSLTWLSDLASGGRFYKLDFSRCYMNLNVDPSRDDEARPFFERCLDNQDFVVAENRSLFNKELLGNVGMSAGDAYQLNWDFGAGHKFFVTVVNVEGAGGAGGGGGGGGAGGAGGAGEGERGALGETTEM